jgi:hypothetical protein
VIPDTFPQLGQFGGNVVMDDGTCRFAWGMYLPAQSHLPLHRLSTVPTTQPEPRPVKIQAEAARGDTSALAHRVNAGDPVKQPKGECDPESPLPCQCPRRNFTDVDGIGLSHTPKLVTKEYIVNKTVEMLGDVAKDIDRGDPEQESSSRDLGHIVMLAAEVLTVGDITMKTAELQEIAVEIDAARDWEANFEEFADIRDSPDALCVMEEIPEASGSQQKLSGSLVLQSK